MIVKDAGAWSSSKMVRYPHIGLELGNFFFTQILHFRAKMVVTSELTTFPYMVKQSYLENRFLFREKIVTTERRQFFCLIWSTSRVSKKKTGYCCIVWVFQYKECGSGRFLQMLSHPPNWKPSTASVFLADMQRFFLRMI